MKKLLAFLICMSTVFATVTLTTPIHRILNDDYNYIGNAAPGQTVELKFSRSTGGDGESRAIFWEKATAQISTAETSILEGDELVVRVKMPEYAKGPVTFPVKLEGTELELIVAETKPITIDVSNDVYTLNYDNTIEADAGKTTRLGIDIISNSIASDSFEVEGMEGLPSEWVKMEGVYVPAKGSGKAVLEVTPFEEGYYQTKINIRRSSADSEVGEVPAEINLRIYPTFKSKLQADGEGLSIVPIILQPFYSLLSLFGWA